MLQVGTKIRIIWKDEYVIENKGVQDYIVFRNTDDKSQYGIVNINTGKCLIESQPTLSDLEKEFNELLEENWINYCEVKQ